MLRAIAFPVIGPVAAEWVDFRKALTTMWEASTALANWAVTELAKADVIRRPGETKCPPMPTVYLYGLAKNGYSGWQHWEGGTGAALCVLRGV
jgi:hypothetical protein